MRVPVLLAAATLVGAVAISGAQAQTTPGTLSYVQALTPQGVQMVQQRLQQQGAYSGRIDGAWGADSQAALEKFQQTHGLQVTGQLNQATAAVLGLQPDQLLAAGQPPVAPATITGDRLSRASVQAVQRRLHELNFYGGPIDGIWGGTTQQAIERFQQGRGLQVNGQLNPATVSALGLDPNGLVQGR